MSSRLSRSPSTSQHRDESRRGPWERKKNNKTPLSFAAERFLAAIHVKQISLCSLREAAPPAKEVTCHYAQRGPCHPRCAYSIL